MAERQLWHSHKYEVESGLLIEPGLTEGIDNAIMKVLVDSYGKTVHSWRWDQKNNSLPLGIPELVNGFTGDGQLPKTQVEERDAYFGVDSTGIGEARAKAGIKAQKVLPGADIWREGVILTLGLVNKTVTVPVFTVQ